MLEGSGNLLHQLGNDTQQRLEEMSRAQCDDGTCMFPMENIIAATKRCVEGPLGQTNPIFIFFLGDEFTYWALHQF